MDLLVNQFWALTITGLAIGAVYATLSRLEQKGFVAFRISDPLPIPGGRSKKFARVTPEGRRALEHAAAMLQRILPGFARGGGHR